MRVWYLTVPVLVLAALAPTIVTAQPSLITESYYVPARKSGVQLYVRNKRPEGVTTFSAEHILLFVHGATYPAETGPGRHCE